MKPVIRFDQTADLPDLQGKSGIVKWFEHRAAAKIAKVPAFRGRAWILRIFFRQFGEIARIFPGLLQQLFCFGPGRILFCLRRGSFNCNQDVGGAAFLRGAEFGFVTVVIIAHIRIVDLDLLYQISCRKSDIGNPCLLIDLELARVLVVIFLYLRVIHFGL